MITPKTGDDLNYRFRVYATFLQHLPFKYSNPGALAKTTRRLSYTLKYSTVQDPQNKFVCQRLCTPSQIFCRPLQLQRVCRLIQWANLWKI